MGGPVGRSSTSGGNTLSRVRRADRLGGGDGVGEGGSGTGGDSRDAEGGDAPRAGEQAPLWGPEHFDDRMRGLFEKYGCRYGLAATVRADG